MGDAADEDRIAERRHRVLTLKLRHMSQSQIAAAVQVDQSTISRDLNWIREHWRLEYGIPGTVSPAEEIGEAVALYADAEQSALRDYHASPPGSRQRQFCLRTAMMARQARLMVLQDVGLIDRQVGTVAVTAIRADDIRALLRAEGLLVDSPRQLAPAHDRLDDGDDPVMTWLHQE